MQYKGFTFPKDVYIFFLIPFRIFHVKKKLKKFGFNKLLLLYKKNNYWENPDDFFILKLKKFYKASSFFLIKIFRDSNPCITRTILLYDYCCQNNFKARIVTGILKEGNNLKGHCWLLIDEKPLYEKEKDLSKFTIVSEV